MKNILDYFPDAKKKTAKEYCSPCPKCGGDDRFVIFVEQNRYLCRGCGAKGDLIQFLRDFQGLSYKEACCEAGKNIVTQNLPTKYDLPYKVKNEERAVDYELWSTKANEFFESNQKLLKTFAEAFLQSRYITLESALKGNLAWNNTDKYLISKDWGVDDDKKLLIPKGLVIASRRREDTKAFLVRTIAHDKPKYWQVKGSGKLPYIIGDSKELVFVMESALDAILLYQESLKIGVQIMCIALNGATKALDVKTFDWLKQSKNIVLIADSDEAGIEGVRKQIKKLPTAKVFKAGKSKDLGELAKEYDNAYIVTKWLEHVLNVLD